MALDFFAGCAGGAAGVIVGHPLDTVKVRIQTQSPDNIKYRGTFQALSQIVKQESVFGLYKGITSPLVGVAGINAIVFGVYGLLRPYVAGSPGNDALWAHFVAGAASGSVQSVICAPMELVKIRMQTNESHAPRESSMDIMKKIYRTEGGLFRGVYKGWMITLLREIPGFGSYFATYELLTTKTGYDVGTPGMLFAGGMAGVVSWILCFPMDVVKTRIQMQSSAKPFGIAECTKQILKTEGYKAFFRGMNSSVIRAFPTNAATFTVVNWIIRLANPKEDDLQNDRSEFVHLSKEWDLSRFQPKEIIAIMNQWAGSPNYSYLSSRCLFPHSSIAHHNANNNSSSRLNILQDFNFLTSSFTHTNNDRNTVALDKLHMDRIQYKEVDYEIYDKEVDQANSNSNNSSNLQTANCSEKVASHASTSSCKSAQCLALNNNQSNSCTGQIDTLVVSQSQSHANTVHEHSSVEYEDSSSPTSSSSSSMTFIGRLTNWLSNFTLTPVHFCKCVDNCNCRD